MPKDPSRLVALLLMMEAVTNCQEKEDIVSAFEKLLLEMLNFVINCLKMEMEALLPMMSKSLENECEIAANNEQTVVVCIVF